MRISMNTGLSGSARIDSTKVLPLGEVRGLANLIKTIEDVRKFAPPSGLAESEALNQGCRKRRSSSSNAARSYGGTNWSLITFDLSLPLPHPFSLRATTCEACTNGRIGLRSDEYGSDSLEADSSCQTQPTGLALRRDTERKYIHVSIRR